MGFTVLLMLFVLMGSVAAADDNITSSAHDEIGPEKISTGNDDSNLNEEILEANNENATLKTAVGGDTFADIQTAISDASSGDTIELDGLYKGSGTAITIDKDNLTIIGNGATLDAQGDSRILNITGTGIILKNIKFINGNVTDNGGAIYWYGDNGTVDGCSFENNTAKLRAGAIYWYGVNGTIESSNFINNTATEMGGAVYWCGINGTVNDSNFSNNSAVKKGGGAIHWDSNSDNGRVNNCNFTNNMGTQKGGAICWCGVNGTVNDSNFINDSCGDQGGAIFWDPTGLNGAVNNCSFVNNTGPNGGAVYWFGAHGSMNGCNFTNNTATDGGAINWQKTYGFINNCNFINNTATEKGGAVYWEGSNGTGTNCNFTSNIAVNGGAVYWYAYNGTINNSNFANNTAQSNGGAVCWNGTNGTVINSNFANNTAASGGAISNGDKTTIDHSKFTNNNATEGRAIETTANMTISNCEFIGNGEYCIDVKSGAKLTLNNVSSDEPLVNDTISMTIIEAGDVVYGSDVNIKVQVNNSAISPLNSGKVVIKVNNVEYGADVKDGIATIVIPGLNIGTYNANVTYIDNNISRAEIPVSFTVNKKDIVIDAKDAAYVINYGGTYKVSFKNANDGFKVTFTLNGKKIGTSTIKNGAASIKLTEKILKAAKAGKRNLVIKFDGDAIYNAASKTVRITISKEKTKIKAKKKTFKRTKKVKKYTVTLKNSKGKAIKKAKVYLKVKGKTYSAKTNSKGKATFKIKKLTKKGKHKATIKFKGNSCYRPVSKSVKITVKK